MDRKLLLLALAVVSSGCMHTTLPNSDFDTPSGKQTSGGLKVATFDISDPTLSPGQPAVITVELENRHTNEINITDPSLYNTGILQVSDMGCSPSELREARPDYTPVMQCQWRVSVSQSDVQSFRSKTIPVKLNLEYNSSLSNSGDPIRIHFMPLDEIDRTNPVEKTFSNNEVSMTVSTESPVSFQGSTIDFEARNAGNGRVDSNFTFNYFPEEVLSGCPDEQEPIVEQQVSFTCNIQPQSQISTTRSFVFSTSYKYVKAPTLDVNVVDQ